MSGHPAAASPDPGEALSAGDHDPDAIAVPGGEKAERRRGGQHQVPFLAAAVPKSRLAERSATTHVSISRSASVVRTWGTSARAVRFQSMRRASSPGS